MQLTNVIKLIGKGQKPVIIQVSEKDFEYLSNKRNLKGSFNLAETDIKAGEPLSLEFNKGQVNLSATLTAKLVEEMGTNAELTTMECCLYSSDAQIYENYEHKSNKSARGSEILGNVLSYILLVVLALVWIIPILWIVLSAFRTQTNVDGQLIGTVVSNYFPTKMGFDNFINLFKQTMYGVKNAFPKWMLNTLIVSVFGCVISTFLILSVAYCMSKLRFKMRKAFMNLTMILGLFPGFMSMIAIYFLLKSIHLTGFGASDEASWVSLIGLTLAYSAGAGMGFQVAKGFFDVLPSSLVESARLDGCSNFKIFTKIILPLSKPIIIYTALTSFTGPWMDFIFAKVIIGDGHPEYWTVSVGLYQMLYGGQADVNLFTQFAAGCVCVAIPIVTLFMFLQKYYVEGVTAGAVKG